MTDDDALAGVRGARGYLLPHHGLMAATMPGVLAAYDRFYRAVALEPRVLDAHRREFVWLALLLATEERYATHHVHRFREAGGDLTQVHAVLALTAVARSARTWHFAEDHWRAQLPDLEAREAYLGAFAAIARPVDPALAHLAGAAVQAALDAPAPLSWHIASASVAGAQEAELAEALSLAMLPGGVPAFVRGADAWRRLVLAGEVAASPALRAWAEQAGQGGFDEARGRAPGPPGDGKPVAD